MNEMFGKKVVLSEKVVCNDPNITQEQKEDLEIWQKCCEHVCNLAKKIENELQ